MITNKHNILLIIADGLRADHIGCYGYHRNTTPGLDKLATEGLLYKYCYTQAPFTTASVASIFTGLYPFQHRVALYTDSINSNNSYLTRTLKELNFRTYAFVHNPHISPRVGYGYFDHFYEGEERIRILSRLGSYFGKFLMWGDAKDINKRFLQTINHQNDDTPFLGFLFYIDTHEPFSPPLKFYREFTNNYHNKFFKIQKKYTKNRFEYEEYSPEDYEEITNRYDGEIKFWDTQLTKLLNELKRRSLYDSTTVIVTSDHGEGFSKRSATHGHLYQEGLHVPLIVKPSQSIKLNDSKQDELVGLIDIFPTIIDITDYNYIGSLPGISLVNKQTRPYIICEDPHGIAVLDKKFKLILRDIGYLSQYSKLEAEANYELYDLINDPQETEDLSQSQVSLLSKYISKVQNDPIFKPYLETSLQVS